ncbi:hypothetical protein, partial [Enhygromyxa salina]|uniref:hypothetical protein n=1 Tax=Enhygromyxa salina TaxID=215803 RepID=UPI0011B1D4B1
MQDDHDTEPSLPPASGPSASAEPIAQPERPSWAEAAGLSGEQVIGDERAPRLHWMLMILGPLGLALAIVSSLWSMSQHVERSVNVQVETQWIAGEQIAVRTQIVGGDLQPLVSETVISLRYLDAKGNPYDLGELETVDSGLAQGVFRAPEVEPGVGELLLHYETAEHSGVEPFEERVPIEVVTERSADRGRQVVSENMLQWADDTDEQPEGVRIDLRPDGRLLAGFDNRLFVRVTDPAGRPWQPKAPPAEAARGARRGRSRART